MPADEKMDRFYRIRRCEWIHTTALRLGLPALGRFLVRPAARCPYRAGTGRPACRAGTARKNIDRHFRVFVVVL